MTLFLQCSAAVLIGSVICLVLRQQNSVFQILVSLCVCAMILTAGVCFLEPVFAFLEELVSVGKLNNELIRILLKAVGIGMIAEIVSLICAEAGNGALGKTLSLIASFVIVWLSIPVFRILLELIREILEQL